MRFFSSSKGRIHCFPIAFLVFAVALVAGGIFPVQVALAASPFLGRFSTISTVGSTVPANGDQNPYGVAVVPRSIGNLVKDDVLVSNFNNSLNQQGTGSTIVQISPSGQLSLFAQITDSQCPGGVGLTTALVVLKQGWVIVGSLPTAAGALQNISPAGCLIVLNSQGDVVETFAGGQINGPWDMTARDDNKRAVLFVTNVLNGISATSPTADQGTILRINLDVPNQGDNNMPSITSTTVIGSGFPERTDPIALIVGPTGLGLGRDGTLYVADTVNSRIAAISDALDRNSSDGTGNTVTEGKAVNGPLGMAIAPNGDILTVNGGDGNIVETTPDGNQVKVSTLDATPPPPGSPSGTPVGVGALFGVAVARGGQGVYFVDNNTNTLNLFH